MAEAPGPKEDSGNIPGVRASVKARGMPALHPSRRWHVDTVGFGGAARSLDTRAPRRVRCRGARTAGLALARGDDGSTPRSGVVASGLLIPFRLPMIVSFARAGAWLLVQAGQLPQRADTVLMRQVGNDPGWFETATAIASGLMSVALLVLTVALVPAAWNFRKSYGKISDLLDRVYGDVNPLMRHASAIADNVNYITTSVRTDVQQVNATIAAANQRLQQAVALTERRLNEFNALLEVVQHEAESMFVATASTVRGVRTGAAALHHEDDEEDAYRASLPTSEELEDGYDDSDAAEAGTTRPRVRPRRRGWA